jgi:hypothetical protein
MLACAPTDLSDDVCGFAFFSEVASISGNLWPSIKTTKPEKQAF